MYDLSLIVRLILIARESLWDDLSNAGYCNKYSSKIILFFAPYYIMHV